MLFVSTSGALGRYIALPATLTIALRALFALLILYGYCRYKKIDFNLASTDRWPIVLSGLFLGGHWVTYFYSLQLSSVAIGMLSIFTYPIITSFLEPVLLKTKFQRIHLLLALMVFLGIYLLNPNFDISGEKTLAVGLGVLSAVLYSLRNIILKSKSQSTMVLV